MRKGYDLKVEYHCFEFADTEEEAKEKCYKRLIGEAEQYPIKQSKEEVMTGITSEGFHWFPDENTHKFMTAMYNARLEAMGLNDE